MASIRNIVPPNYPIATDEYSKQAQDQYTNILRLFSNTLVNAINAPKIYGSFYDTTQQNNAGAGLVNLMRYNSTTSASGIKLAGTPTSRITVTDTGIYNFQFSAQFNKTGFGASDVYVWLRQNGTDVSASGGKMVINGPNAEVLPSWNYVLPLTAGDYLELAWMSPTASMYIEYAPASGVLPSIPSVIATITWISNVPV
jgi:hypothetical protein